MTSPLKYWLEAEGRLVRLRLNKPKANLINAEMIAALEAAFAKHLRSNEIAAVLLDAEGPHFSFGASVEEHLPDRCETMLRSLHRVILHMVESPVPILVAVRGHCLGGGLEVAMAAHLMFVAPDAHLAQPEMKLGVFAPAASCLLPELVGPGRAIDLLLSGRGITGSEAVTMGLARESSLEPERAALAYFQEHIKPKSASSLRLAVRAARLDFCARVRSNIERVERIYLDELMATHDAVEGLNAFLEKRAAQWQQR
ncbi:MAG TPA: cyclohexa-1,5-dienecarbonyl-CoA hydratase [Xanthobacteraceae bacterium]|nr:cyclohexa-1,5-dienecarbonyl-CoA hydratase [Xanthobacteraceae bacterium]